MSVTKKVKKSKKIDPGKEDRKGKESKKVGQGKKGKKAVVLANDRNDRAGDLLVLLGGSKGASKGGSKGGKTRLPLLKLGKDETLLGFFTTKFIEVRSHNGKKYGIQGTILCNSPDGVVEK